DAGAGPAIGRELVLEALDLGAADEVPVIQHGLPGQVELLTQPTVDPVEVEEGNPEGDCAGHEATPCLRSAPTRSMPLATKAGRPVDCAMSVAASTRTMSRPRSPGVFGVAPVRMHSMKWLSWTSNGSLN